MADSKYGRLFTEEDVRQMVEAAVHAGIELAADDGYEGERAQEFNGDAVFEAVSTGFNTKWPAEEPLFVLRAQDKAAAETIDHYWTLCEHEGSPEQHLDAVNKVYAEFTKFSTDNSDKMKAAD